MPDRFDFDAYLSIPRLSGLRLSPDGRRLVVAVAGPSADGKKMQTALWEVDPDGEREPRRLTRSSQGESNAAFLRDGSLLFTSTRPDPDRKPDDDSEEEETSRLWMLPADGGEARVIATAPGGIEDVRTARDADVLAVAVAVDRQATDLADDRAREKRRKDADVEALLFDDYPTRYWDHYLGPRQRRLFVAEAPGADGRVAELRDLTPDAQIALEDGQFSVLPDGSGLLASWQDHADLVRPRSDIMLVGRDGERRALTPGDAWYVEPEGSPDGRWVVCVRSTWGTPDEPPEQTLWLIDRGSGDGRDLTPELDLWPHAPVWAPDSSAVFVVADREGGVAAFRVAVPSGDVTLLSGDGAFADLCPSPDGSRVFALRNSVDDPPRPVALDAAAAGERRVLRSPVPSPEELALPGEVERLSTPAADGIPVGSWLVRPRDASADSPGPTVLWSHGGPLGSWNAWSWRWNPHLLAARGYAVLLPDPGLSTGYGQRMLRRGWGKWHEQPYTDVITALEAALAERPELDGSRLGMMGGSFGGYMANWIAGHETRFRGIVTHASLWELRGFHGTTDFGPAWETEFGDPYRDASRYEAASPHRALAAIRTPMLVIHGERDLRVPISEALRLWTDLRRHGVPARFLYYPDENHWILKPNNARLWYETVLAFLDEQLLGSEWQRPALV